jgi:hypothetical protein
MTARELCALPDPPQSDQLLGQLLMKGDCLIVGGATGHGKTTLALQLAKSVVTGREFLDWTGTGGRVLAIDAEQGERSAKRRLREAGLADCDDITYVRSPGGLRLDSDDGELDEIEALIADGNFAVVLMDPLYKLHAGDSNDERHVGDLMRRLDALRDRYRFALILTAHLRKRQVGRGGFTIDDIFGSSVFTRGPEVVLGVQRTRPGAAKLHFFKDRDGDLPVSESWGLLFDRDQGFRRDPEDGKSRETAADRVGTALLADPDGLTLEQAMEVGGCSDRTARKALKDLGAEASTGLHGAKTWRLPSGDQEELL